MSVIFPSTNFSLEIEAMRKGSQMQGKIGTTFRSILNIVWIVENCLDIDRKAV